MNNNLIKLSELTKITSGFAFSSSRFNTSNKGMQLIRIRDVNTGDSETFYDGEYEARYVVNKGDYLISMDGEFKLNRWNSRPALLNQRVCKIEIVSEKLNDKYLYYFLPKELKRIEDKTPFVTVKHLSATTIANIQIPVPPFEEQERIALTLEQSDVLRQKRKQAIDLLDEYIKSVFVEMFGDPFKNQKNWGKMKLEDLCTEIADIDHNMPKATEEGYPFISAKDLLDDGTISFENVKHISEKDFIRLSRKIKPEKGDIIYSRIGAKLGKARIVEVDFDFLASYSCCTIRPVSTKIDKEFLNHALNTPSLLRQALSDVRAIGVPDLGMDKIRAFEIIVPPMELQLKFVEIALNVKKIKQKMFEQSKELDNQFQALMQKSFQIN